MKRNIQKLCVQAFNGSGKAYRKLGIILLRHRKIKSRRLAKCCLQKAAELGDEGAYLLYHRLFSRGKKIIDDQSYEDLCRDYRKERVAQKKRKLGRYLELGTQRQKEQFCRTR